MGAGGGREGVTDGEDRTDPEKLRPRATEEASVPRTHTRLVSTARVKGADRLPPYRGSRTGLERFPGLLGTPPLFTASYSLLDVLR